jgi:hypothetical protein
MKITKIKHISSLIFTLFIYSYAIDLNAQAICGFDERYKKEYKNNPILRMKMELFEKEIKGFTKNNSARLAVANSTVYIPVVVHVIHTGDPIGTAFNPDDDTIIQAIDFLNQVYNGTWYPQQGVGDVGIQFTLAQRTPLCENTNGIVRKDYSYNQLYKQSGVQDLPSDIGIPELDLKNDSRWDPNQYLNIWLVNYINGKNSTIPGKYIGGYSSFPKDPELFDGVVIIANQFRFGNILLSHEIGHIFNLFHPWGVEEGVCGDDEVSDTDPVSENYDVARTGSNPCNDYKLYSDNTEKNIMSYSTTDRTLFTQGQKDRMRASLELSRRKSLVNSLGDEPVDSISCGKKIYDMSNTFDSSHTPVFTTNTFKTLGVGKEGYIYAGTANAGLYKFNGSEWSKLSTLTDNNINDIKTDKNGGIWIAQYGNTSTQAINGGINYYPNTDNTGYEYFPPSTSGLPTRNCRALFIDTTSTSSIQNPKIWTANMAHYTLSLDDNGEMVLVRALGHVGIGLFNSNPRFGGTTEGIDIFSETSTGIQTIGGDENEIWAFAQGNYNKNQILVYDSQTTAYKKAYDRINIGISLPANFLVKAIYFDVLAKKKMSIDRRWVGVSNGGVLVYQKQLDQAEGNWSYINHITHPTKFPENSFVNNNSITSDESGYIYFGTTQGMVVFSGKNTADSSNYKRFTMADGLPSNNVLDIAISTFLGKIIIATDKGIVFWSQSRFTTLSEPCPPTLVISTPNYTTETLTRQANTITASNQITNTAKINYQAKTIVFGEGFKAQPTAGGYFKAEIGGCN